MYLIDFSHKEDGPDIFCLFGIHVSLLPDNDTSFHFPLQEVWGYLSFEFIGTRSTQSCQAFTRTGAGCATSTNSFSCTACHYPWDKGHEGHRAWTTKDVLDGKPGREPGVREFLQTGEKADIVLLMIGNNDIYKGFITDFRCV